MSTDTREEILSVTEEAAQELKSRLESQEQGTGLRIFVEEGGCSGLQYGMVFDDKRVDDLVIEKAGVSVFLDPASAGFMRGSVLDFSDELIGGGFLIHNPNAKESCGCGHSFHT